MTDTIIHVDRALLLFVVSHRVGLLDTLLWTLSVVGRGGIVWLAVGAVLALRRRLSVGGYVRLALAVLMASTLADQVLKPLVSRERPFVAAPEVQVIGGRPDDASFPSGHTANAFASAFVLSRLVPQARIAWWVLALAIGYSRIYLGVHYPLDVAGGAAVGLLCGFLALLPQPKGLRH